MEHYAELISLVVLNVGGGLFVWIGSRLKALSQKQAESKLISGYFRGYAIPDRMRISKAEAKLQNEIIQREMDAVRAAGVPDRVFYLDLTDLKEINAHARKIISKSAEHNYEKNSGLVLVLILRNNPDKEFCDFVNSLEKLYAPSLRVIRGEDILVDFIYKKG